MKESFLHSLVSKDKATVEPDGISPQHRALHRLNPTTELPILKNTGLSPFALVCWMKGRTWTGEPGITFHSSIVNRNEWPSSAIWLNTCTPFGLLNGIPFIGINVLLLNVCHKTRENLKVRKERGQENTDVKQPRDKPSHTMLTWIIWGTEGLGLYWSVLLEAKWKVTLAWLNASSQCCHCLNNGLRMMAAF